MGGHQIPDVQEPLKVWSHGVVVHGHEDGVEDDAEGDAEVDKGICDDGQEKAFDLPPAATAIPLQEDGGQGKPAGRTRPLVLLQVWRRQGLSEVWRKLVYRLLLLILLLPHSFYFSFHLLCLCVCTIYGCAFLFLDIDF